VTGQVTGVIGGECFSGAKAPFLQVGYAALKDRSSTVLLRVVVRSAAVNLALPEFPLGPGQARRVAVATHYNSVSCGAYHCG
jgi:hypothetical protein